MRYGALRLMLVAFLVLAATPRGGAGDVLDLDAELARGSRQVEEGDFEQAIETFDRLVPRLRADKARSKDLTHVYVYLGVSYLGLGHERLAKARFRDAISENRDLLLSPDQSPKVLQLFRQALDEARSGTRAARSAPTPLPLPPAEGQGMLQISVGPWAEVAVDGINVGLTPFGRIPARVGAHAVRIEHPGFEPVERHVVVRHGQVTKLVVNLAVEGTRRMP